MRARVEEEEETEGDQARIASLLVDDPGGLGALTRKYIGPSLEPEQAVQMRLLSKNAALNFDVIDTVLVGLVRRCKAPLEQTVQPASAEEFARQHANGRILEGFSPAYAAVKPSADKLLQLPESLFNELLTRAELQYYRRSESKYSQLLYDLAQCWICRSECEELHLLRGPRDVATARDAPRRRTLWDESPDSFRSVEMRFRNWRTREWGFYEEGDSEVMKEWKFGQATMGLRIARILVADCARPSPEQFLRLLRYAVPIEFGPGSDATLIPRLATRTIEIGRLPDAQVTPQRIDRFNLVTYMMTTSADIFLASIERPVFGHMLFQSRVEPYSFDLVQGLFRDFFVYRPGQREDFPAELILRQLFRTAEPFGEAAVDEDLRRIARYIFLSHRHYKTILSRIAELRGFAFLRPTVQSSSPWFFIGGCGTDEWYRRDCTEALEFLFQVFDRDASALRAYLKQYQSVGPVDELPIIFKLVTGVEWE